MSSMQRLLDIHNIRRREKGLKEIVPLTRPLTTEDLMFDLHPEDQTLEFERENNIIGEYFDRKSEDK